MSLPRVVVVGAGVAGLAAAAALRGCADVTVLEATDVVGGKLRTGPLGVDEGAESFLARRPEGLAAAADAGVELVGPGTTSASVWLSSGLRPLPPGTVLGVPTNLAAAAPVLGFRGTARAALDRVLPRSPLPDDPAVGAFVRTRLGDAVVDRLVDPLLGGVYAGNADELSLRATAPQLVPALSERSLLAAAARLRTTPAPDAGPVFMTAAAGLGSLALALARQVPGDVVTGSPVRTLERHGSGWRLAGMQCEAVVLAVPAAPAGRLLAGVGVIAPDVAYASVALATFIYPEGTELPPGSGLLVPPSRGRTMKAATFLSQKWPHLTDQVPGVVVRASAGRYGQARDLQRDDTELAGVLAADLAAATGIRSRPSEMSVARWGGGLPQYTPGHLGRVAALRRSLPQTLAVCGAAWDGVGIPACIASGKMAAQAVLSSLR